MNAGDVGASPDFNDHTHSVTNSDFFNDPGIKGAFQGTEVSKRLV
jgi:hypothetical protein